MALTSSSSAAARERSKLMMSPTKTKVVKTKTSSSDGGAMPAFSLELLSKKRDILLVEVEKLDECLRHRTQLMCKLRETLETLLTSNGNLEESARLRESKLEVIRSALAVTADAINASEAGSHSLNPKAGSQKLLFCDALLVSLDNARVQLGVSCMQGEEELSRQADSYRQALAACQLAHEQAQMTKEEMSSVAFALQFELLVTKDAEDRMTISSHKIEREKLSASDTKTRLDAKKMHLDDLRISVENAHGMLSEDLDGLYARKAIAERDNCEVQDLLRKSGAALPEDFEVEENVRLLGRKLELLTVKISESKLGKRDAVLRRKEEANILAMAKANVGSREDQLKWLERQLNYLKREHNGMLTTRNADRDAFNDFKQKYEEQMATIVQYLASVAKEATTIVEQVAIADASISRTRLEHDTQSGLLYSRRECHAKKTLEVERIRDENKSAEAKIGCLVNSMSKLQSRQSELMSNANRLGMACEDELSEQQRCAESADDSLHHADITEESCLKTTNSIDEKIATLRACICHDVSRSTIDKLIQVTTQKIQCVKEEKMEELARNENTLKTDVEKLKAHYDEMMESMQVKYAEAIAIKRQEHERLLRELSEKAAVVSAAASGLSKADESPLTTTISPVSDLEVHNTVKRTSVKPTGRTIKPLPIAGKVRRQGDLSLPRSCGEECVKSAIQTTKSSSTAGKGRRQGFSPPPAHDKAHIKTTIPTKKNSLTAGKVRREVPSNLQSNHEDNSNKKQGSTNEASSSRSAQSIQAQAQDLLLMVTSSTPPAPKREAANRNDVPDKAQAEVSPPWPTTGHKDLAVSEDSCTTTNPLKKGHRQRHQAPRSRQKTNLAQPSATKSVHAAHDVQPTRKPQTAATSEDSIAAQSHRVEKCAPPKKPTPQHSADHLQGAPTQAIQPPKASARVAIPKTNVIKPAAKSARLPTSSKMKARKASQAVDWCADDSFSFS